MVPRKSAIAFLLLRGLHWHGLRLRADLRPGQDVNRPRPTYDQLASGAVGSPYKSPVGSQALRVSPLSMATWACH